MWRCAVLRGRRELSAVSGGYGERETPLPIPNRAVKPLSADGTWPERARESRTPPVYLRTNEPLPSGRLFVVPGGLSLRCTSGGVGCGLATRRGLAGAFG